MLRNLSLADAYPPRLLFFLAVSCSLFTFCAEAQNTSSGDYNEQLVKNYLRKFGTKSLVIGVIKDGVQTVKGYGTINSRGEKHTIPDGHTIYEIGSITKVFTTLMLADLVAKDSLRLTDRVLDFLPENPKGYSPGLKDVTLLNLATHTSGLPRITSRSINGYYLSVAFTYLAVYRFIFGFDVYKNYDTTKLLRDMKRIRPESRPGRKFSYSNLGVSLLGYILTQKSKSTFDTLLRKTILDPLAMDNTWTDLPKSSINSFATGHNWLGLRTPRWTFRTNMEGAGAINSTANDLLTFLNASLADSTNRIHDLLEQCQQTYFQESAHRSIGLAWIKSNSKATDNQEIIWHNGGTGGFRSFLGFNKATKVGVVILSNSSKEVNGLALSILNQLTNKNRNMVSDIK